MITFICLLYIIGGIINTLVLSDRPQSSRKLLSNLFIWPMHIVEHLKNR